MEGRLTPYAELRGSRLPRTRRPLLADIVLIAIAAILCGTEGWDDIERYGKAKRHWLSEEHRRPNRRTEGRLHLGRQAGPAIASGRYRGFFPDAGTCRRRSADRRQTQVRGSPPLRGLDRSEPDGQHAELWVGLRSIIRIQATPSQAHQRLRSRQAPASCLRRRLPLATHG